jgi:type VII secretion protein EccB
MQTRKDLLQAHRLMTQRASQALILGEPDTPEMPLRRLNVAAFMGVMVAVLVFAGFGILGLLSPGGAQGLEQPGTIIIEKETGARYVWCQGSKLCPVENYTSAKLLAGSGQTGQRLVSRNSLAKYDRGPLLGIPGAPDTLPDPSKLVKMPWSVCVRAADLELSGHTSFVTLVAGKSVGGQPLKDDQAILVQADKQPWVIWRNKRMRVSPDEVPALTSTASVPEVAGKWLNALTAGSDFKGPIVPGLGGRTSGPDGQGRIGQIFTVANVTGSSSASYVLMADGLAQISDIEAQLMKADPATRAALGAAANPTTLAPDAYGRAPKHAGNISSPDLRGKMPTFAQYTDASPLCSTYTDASGNTGAQVTVGAQLPPPPASATGGANSVDQLIFPPGGAALAGVLPSTGKGAAVSTMYLVTEGRRFALQSKDVAPKLGYSLTTDMSMVPAGVVELIPSGPVLDPTLAAREVTQASQPSTQPTG